MKIRMILILFILVSMKLSALPHPIYVQLRNAEDQIPLEDNIHFEASLYSNPTEFLTEEAVDCYYPAFSDYLKINVDQFYEWMPGDTLRLQVWEISTSNYGIGEFLISIEASQFFDIDDGGIRLLDNQPVVQLTPPEIISLQANQVNVVDFSPYITGNGTVLTADDSPNISISIDGYDVSFQPANNWTGTETALFTLIGLCSFQDSAFVQLSVEESNSQSIEIEPLEIISNYPNPFNPETTISFTLPQTGAVDLGIYNIKGNRVKTLLAGDIVKGKHSVVWSGDNDMGNKVSSGIYYYRLSVNGQIKLTKKCLLLK